MADKVTIVNNTIGPSLRKIKAQLNELPEDAYKVFVQETPIRSGNARRNTKLRNNKTIVANYNYAKKLDEGASKQSPDGMTKPMEEFIRKQLGKIMRK
jgi:hypothetical protein